MALTDRQLVERTLLGERAAFGELVERYCGLVRGLVAERLRRFDDVEDVVQETFCKAYEDLGSLRDRSRFGPWLRQIAGNTALDWERSRQIRSRVSADHVALALYPQPAMADSVAEADTKAHLWQLIDRLSPEHRQVLVLRYVEDCSLREIARFLGVSAPAIHWRLRRAQRMLGVRLAASLRGLQEEEDAASERTRKIMAAVPLTVLFRPPMKAAGAMRALAGLGAIGGAVLLGLGLSQRIDTVAERRSSIPEAVQAAPLRIHTREWEPPGLAMSWSPRQPRPGQEMRVEVAGPDLPPGTPAFLHYITDPEYPLDHVVPLEPDGDAWSASVSVPDGCPALFLHAVGGSAAAGGQPIHFDPAVGRNVWLSWLEPYRWTVTMSDSTGRSQPGALVLQAKMERAHGASDAQVLALLDRELASHPDEVAAYRERWDILRTSADSGAVDATIRLEFEALRARLPDRPDAWWPPGGSGDEAIADLQEIVDRLPEWERADEAAYEIALRYLRWGRDAEASTALAALRRGFPGSPYLDEAISTTLGLEATRRPAVAAALADSLIDGSLQISWTRQGEGSQRMTMVRVGGLTPVGYAYSVRFELHSREGRERAARDLGRRLASSGLVDPGAYLYVGQILCGRAAQRLLGAKVSAGPRDDELAEALLRTGLEQVRQESLVGMPGLAVGEYLPAHVQDEYRRLRLRMIAGLGDQLEDALRAIRATAGGPSATRTPTSNRGALVAQGGDGNTP